MSEKCEQKKVNKCDDERETEWERGDKERKWE